MSTTTILFPLNTRYPLVDKNGTISPIFQKWLLSLQNLLPMVEVDTSSGAVSVALPPAGLNSATGQSNQNQEIIYCKTSADGNSLTVTGAESGEASTSEQWGILRFKSDGTNWIESCCGEGGGGGGVSGSGTIGTIPIWTGTTSLGNSGLIDSGSTLTYAGNEITTSSVNLLLKGKDGTGTAASLQLNSGTSTAGGAVYLYAGDSAAGHDGRPVEIGGGSAGAGGDAGGVELSIGDGNIGPDSRVSVLGSVFVVGDSDDGSASVGAGEIGYTSRTAATATGGAATLPGNPEGFMEINVAGVVKKIPYYAA